MVTVEMIVNYLLQFEPGTEIALSVVKSRQTESSSEVVYLDGVIELLDQTQNDFGLTPLQQRELDAVCAEHDALEE